MVKSTARIKRGDLHWIPSKRKQQRTKQTLKIKLHIYLYHTHLGYDTYITPDQQISGYLPVFIH